MSHREPAPSELVEYVSLVNRGEFYEAHEVLEDLWVIEVPPLKEYYKGLIMASVALCHWQRGNTASARRMFDAAIPRLHAAPMDHGGLDLGPFLEVLRELRRQLDGDGHPTWGEARQSAWRPARILPP